MDWLDILVSFVLNGVLLVVIQSFLQRAHDRELTQLNAELNKVHMIQTTRFADLHKRRAEVMAELYKHLAKAERELALTRIPTPLIGLDDKSRWQSFVEKTRPVHEVVTEVADYYEDNRIFLSVEQADLMDGIINIFKNLKSSWTMTEQLKATPIEEVDEQDALWRTVTERLVDTRQAFDNVYPKIKSSLESSFREILGFGIT